jgi:hypothetical protein
MTRILLWLFLLTADLGAIPVPGNHWAGMVLYWQEGLNSRGLLQSLHDEGVRTLILPAGSTGWTPSLGVFSNAIRYSQSEKDWENRYPFQNLIEVELENGLVRALGRSPLKVGSELSVKLMEQLEQYRERVGGVVLKVGCQEILPETSLKIIHSHFQKSDQFLGLSICAEDIQRTPILKPAPDLLVVRLNLDDLHEERVLRSYSSSLASWNRPYFFHTSLAPVLKQSIPKNKRYSRSRLSDQNQLIADAQGNLIKPNEFGFEREIRDLGKLEHLGESTLRKVKEKMRFYSKETELEVTREFSLSGYRFRKGERLYRVEPGMRGLHHFLKLASRMEPYWYSGTAIDLGSWNPRILLKNSSQLQPPRVYYQINPGKDGVEIELSLENPNPVPSSRDSKAAGIALRIPGYKIKGIDLGEFDQIRAMGGTQGDRIFLSVTQLASYSRVSNLKLRLEESGENGSVNALGWFLPRAESKFNYDAGAQQDLLPEFAILEHGQTIWHQGAERTR